MASATGGSLAFTFRILNSNLPLPTRSKSLLSISIPHSQKTLVSVFPKSPANPRKISLSPMSIDISKQDKPLSDESETPSNPATGISTDSPAPDDEIRPKNDDVALDPRRFEEKFAVLNTGIYECRSCGYKYDEAVGDPSYPIPPGLEFGKLPEDWRCPTCGAAQSFFESKSIEIAGFAQNQQFGLGGNSLTSSQKAFLIYGSLFFIFLLFLSGYFIQ